MVGLAIIKKKKKNFTREGKKGRTNGRKVKGKIVQKGVSLFDSNILRC